MQLSKDHGVPVVDHGGQVPGLGLGLVGGVAVEVIAVGVPTLVEGASVRILGGLDDEDNVVQDLVHIQGLVADGV